MEYNQRKRTTCVLKVFSVASRRFAFFVNLADFDAVG